MADPFKKLMKGKTKVPILNKTLPNIQVAGGVAVALIAVYMYTKGRHGGGGVDTGYDAPLVAVAPNVDFVVIPDQVRPNSYITITGMFMAGDGTAVSVPEGFYYVFENTGVNGRELRARGSLGNKVSRFNMNIPTPNFRQGKYAVVVTDEPLDEQQIGPLNNAVGPYGSGISSIQPSGSSNPTSGRNLAIS